MLQLMAELRCVDSELSDNEEPSSSDQPSISDQPSTSQQQNTLEIPNGLPSIQESVSDKTVGSKPPRSPSGTSRPPSGTSRPLSRSPNSASGKSKAPAPPRSLAAAKQQAGTRRSSDSSVVKKPLGPKLRPGSVSTSKMQSRSSSTSSKKPPHS